MDKNTYLEKVLSAQDLADDSEELKELQEHRKSVEKVLRDAFPRAGLTIRYGGSKAKGTLNRESYDIDIVCYFANDSDQAGTTLKDIYSNVAEALSVSYYVQRKTSALRLKDRSNSTSDLHIDVIPGRFVDASQSDCFLHQETGDKERLKTNLDKHISHVRDSGVVPAIRLLKLWKVRRQLRIRQFVFELLIIKLLEDHENEEFSGQLERVWNEVAKSESPLPVQDPANPEGNDLSPLLSTDVWNELVTAAQTTIEVIGTQGWEAVFGPADDDSVDKRLKLKQAAAAPIVRSKPWLAHEETAQ